MPVGLNLILKTLISQQLKKKTKKNMAANFICIRNKSPFPKSCHYVLVYYVLPVVCSVVTVMETLRQ